MLHIGNNNGAGEQNVVDQSIPYQVLLSPGGSHHVGGCSPLLGMHSPNCEIKSAWNNHLQLSWILHSPPLAFTCWVQTTIPYKEINLYSAVPFKTFIKPHRYPLYKYAYPKKKDLKHVMCYLCLCLLWCQYVCRRPCSWSLERSQCFRSCDRSHALTRFIIGRLCLRAWLYVSTACYICPHVSLLPPTSWRQ